MHASNPTGTTSLNLNVIWNGLIHFLYLKRPLKGYLSYWANQVNFGRLLTIKGINSFILISLVFKLGNPLRLIQLLTTLVMQAQRQRGDQGVQSPLDFQSKDSE